MKPGNTLRVMLERRDKPYVLSIRGNERGMRGDFRTPTAEDLAAGLSGDDGRRLPAGEGSKGPRLYDWARLRLFRLQSPPWDHWLLIRRSIADPEDFAFYVTFGPPTTELNELAAVAGLRWTIEECFQSAKAGLDHCEARSWHGWHRHLTLSMLALAFLAGLRARLKEAQIDISVFLVATAILWLMHPTGVISTVAKVVATGSLIIWALDEVVRGVNPWRCFLGVAVLIYVVSTIRL
jgi:SRSO17 transposase